MPARAACAGLAAGWAAICVAVLALTTGWARGALGDLAVVALLAHAAGAVLPTRPVGARAGGAFALAAAIEVGQAFGVVGAHHPAWLQFLFGRTFDPLDLLAYGVGAGLAVVGERALVRTAHPG